MTEPTTGRWLTVGLAVSLVVHALLIGLLVSAASGAGAVHAPDHDRERSPDEVRFGLETPPRATINWLGIQDPSPEHVAPDEAESEQAALAIDAAGGPAAQPAADASEPAATPEPDAADSTEAPTSIVIAPPEPEAIMPEAPQAEETVDAAPTDADDAATDPVVDAITQPTPARTSPDEPASAADSGSGPTQGEGNADAPGKPDERESDATAKVPTVDIRRWTSPAVGQGIEIRPVRPRWPTHFGLGRLTRPALVEITFHRPPDRPGGDEGPAVVQRAQFARVELADGTFEVRSSGDPAVDSIVLNTIYRWTATGARIDELAEGESLTVGVRLFSVR